MSPRAGSNVVWVCDSFYPNLRTWDPGKLASCFLPWEAKKVGGIYVGEAKAEAILIWPLSPYGSYSVQRAYRMLMEVENSALPSSSSLMSLNIIWKKIWKLKVPNKVRHFLWRVVRDSFPTKQNLKHRHLPLDDTCDGYNDQSESFMHVLWLYEQARAIWLSVSNFLLLTQKNCKSFLEILETLFSVGSGFQCALFAMIAWCLWERRNRVRERQRNWQLHEVGDRARDLVQEYWDIHFKEKSIHVHSLVVRWSPPSAQCYKINFDAAILEGTNRVGIRVVCRDSEGHVLVALSRNVALVQSDEMAKALVGKRATEFAKELSIFDVQIEGDCLCVIQALQDSDCCFTLFGHIIEETKRLGSFLQQCQFHHV